MSIISIIILAVNLWGQYGGAIEVALSIIVSLEKLDNGALLSDVEKIFASHGVNLADVLNSVTTATGGNSSDSPIGGRGGPTPWNHGVQSE